MRLALAFAAVAGLIAAPAAHAQLSCAEINRINSESSDEFDAIMGEEIDDDVFGATYTLNGAHACTVDYTFDSIYSCDYQFTSYSAGNDARNTMAATLSACLPGWRSSTVPADSEAKDGYRTLAGTLLANPSDEDLEWAAVIQEHTDTNGTHYHVWLELAYYW